MEFGRVLVNFNVDQLMKKKITKVDYILSWLNYFFRGTHKHLSFMLSSNNFYILDAHEVYGFIVNILLYKRT